MIKKQTLLLTILLGFSCSAMAGALQQWTQSAASLGDAGAGAAASAKNPDTSFFNPAGSPWIQHQDMGFSLEGQFNSVEYQGTQTPTPAISGFTNSGTAQGGRLLYLPNLFYVAPLNLQWAVGLSVSSPYRTKQNYGSTSFARYSVANWSLKTRDIMPSLAYRFIPQLSIGFGVDIQEADLGLQQKSTVTASNNERLSNTKLSDWAYGWTGGLIWQPVENTRVGLAYHSFVSHKNAGNSKANGQRYRAKAHYRLPAWTSLSVYQKLNESWTLLGTANYTQWSQLGQLTINNTAAYGGAIDPTLFDHLRNTWLLSLGAHYQLNTGVLLKSGFAYQEGTSSDRHRSILLSDISHYIFALGGNYQINQSFNLDLAYSHAFNKSGAVNHAQTINGGSMNSTGDIEVNADTLGLQLNWLMT